jgi:hypothetical protein
VTPRTPVADALPRTDTAVKQPLIILTTNGREAMKRQALAIAAICIFALTGAPSEANATCSIKDIAGKWMFATGIGRQSLGGPFPPEKDITAIGTMNINRDGTLEGKFDVTVEDTFPATMTYSGSVVVNPDCTGTLTFVTSGGSARTDSIAIVSRKEILGMSQDPANLWTYQIRRIAANLVGYNRNKD